MPEYEITQDEPQLNENAILDTPPAPAYGENDGNINYHGVRIILEYAKENNTGLYLTNTQHLTKKNLIGDNGYFKVRVEFLYKFLYVRNKITYTLDEWIAKATGKVLSENGEEWENGGTTEPGFYIDFDNGTLTGSSEGKKTVTLRFISKVIDGYQSVSAQFTIDVTPGFYEDNYGEKIGLRPVRISNDVRFQLEEGVYTTIDHNENYFLVDESVSSNETSNTIFTINGTTQRRIDKKTGQYHYFLNGIEIFGFVRNVLAIYTDGASIPPNGEVVLFNDYEPAIMGESNIEVKFPCYVKGNADRINKCRIAKLFGNSNAKNRLFVAGNPDYPNCDWHTSAANDHIDGESAMESNGDFTYFGDMDYCFYGQTDNAIMGYDNVATDKMVVIKSKSKVEPTNYFRTSSLIQAVDASGNALSGIDGSTLYQESFPLATGNIGAGAMNMRSIANLNGDTLYLSSENTICGLDIAGQVGDSQRISYSRSKYIDPELKELDLSDAFLWSDNSYLCLFADKYIYLTHYETFDSETSQYEWFKLDVGKVGCAIELNNAIYFGNEDGKFYVFEKETYEDIDKVDVSVGGTLYSNDKITYNSAINEKISVDDKLTFRIKERSEEPLFRRVANVHSSEDNGVDLVINHENNSIRIVAKNESGGISNLRYDVLSEELAYGGYFYFDKPDGSQSILTNGESDIVAYQPYRIVASDDAFDEYKVLVGDTENEADLSTLLGANLCRPLDGEYEITDLDKENCTFKIRYNGRLIDVILYNNQDMMNLSFPSEIRKHKTISAKFITAPATLGGINYRKTIWQWTMTASDKPNDLKVCQATNEERFEDMKQMAFADNIPIGLDFKQLTFMSLDFGKSAIPRKYSYFRPISVPFISFGFKSDKPANSILTAVAITYTIPMLGWGNR